MRIMKDPVEAAREWRATYGKTFRLPMMPFDWVVTCEPELVRAIHANHDHGLFYAGVNENIDPLFGPRSLLRLADEAHNRERKLMMPPFHGERMRGWAKTMADIGRKAFAVGTDPVRAMDRTRHATLEVILRLVFGVRDEARVQTFQAAIEYMRQFFAFIKKTHGEVGPRLAGPLALCPLPQAVRARRRDALRADRRRSSRAS
jgi:cytochrome P450